MVTAEAAKDAVAGAIVEETVPTATPLSL